MFEPSPDMQAATDHAEVLCPICIVSEPVVISRESHSFDSRRGWLIYHDRSFAFAFLLLVLCHEREFRLFLKATMSSTRQQIPTQQRHTIASFLVSALLFLPALPSTLSPLSRLLVVADKFPATIFLLLSPLSFDLATPRPAAEVVVWACGFPSFDLICCSLAEVTSCMRSRMEPWANFSIRFILQRRSET